MIARILLVLFMGVSLTGIGQGAETFDFGALGGDDLPFHDFQITNNENEVIYVLRSDHEEDVQVLFSDKAIKPGESAVMRVQYNPQKKGGFRRKIDVWMSNSNKPITYQIQGSARFVAPSLDIPCPGFKPQNENPMDEFELTILIVDSVTKEPVPNLMFDLSTAHGLDAHPKTNSQGKVLITTQLGMHGVTINPEEYKPIQTFFYANKSRNLKVFLLQPLAENLPPPEPLYDLDTIYPQINLDSLEAALNSPTLPDPIIEALPEPEDPIDDSVVVPTEPAPESSPTFFPETEYKPNNLVFLLDVSGSMAKRGKLERMQASMDSLIAALRPMDKVTLITYADGVVVLAEGVSGNEKGKLRALIQSLETGGLTEEEEGLKAAYRIAYENRIESGNNLILLFTDGAFDPDNKKKGRIIFLGKQRGTKLSVGGIDTSTYTREMLEEMADQGGGNYVEISPDKPGTSLIQEIQIQSKRY